MLRCPICDWPLANSVDEGCIPGNCSYRPDPHASPEEYARIQRRREVVKTLPSDLGPRDVMALFSLPDDDDTMHSGQHG